MIQNADDYFDMVRSPSPSPVNQASQAVPEVVDANGDGVDDILIFGAWYPHNGGGAAAVGQPALLMLGKGDGTYAPAPTGMLPSTFTTIHPREVVQADFNKDGLIDLFVADHGYDAEPYPGAQNRLLLGKQGGGYIDASANLPQLADYSHSATVGDINRDGNLDIFVGNLSSPASPIEPYVLFGDGTGKFARSNAGLPVEGDGLLNRQKGAFGFNSSLLTDLNGDGRLDLVLGNDGNVHNREHRSLVYWGTASGFNAATVTPLPQGYFGDTRVVHDIAALDIDGDGDNDLLLLSSESTPSTAYADGWSLEVLRNDGGSFVDATLGHFKAADSREGLPNQDSNIGASQFIRLMDVNGDGSKDIVITQFMNEKATENTPVVWVNDGFGHFEVALRAGQLNTLAGDPYFVGVFNLPIETAKGLSFSSINTYQGTVYTNTALATKLLPGPAVITATARNDVIAQTAVANTINGGEGRDKVVYAKAAASYQVTLKDGTATVRDLSGQEGTDTLVGVERLQFGDTGIALDIGGTAGQAYRVYQAAFARTPDLGGLGYWLSMMDNGAQLGAVAAGFVDSKEFRDVYGAAPSNREIVEKFYQNVLQRAGEKAGVDYWTSLLDTKQATVGSVLVGFSESPENQAALVGVMANGVAYTPYG